MGTINVDFYLVKIKDADDVSSFESLVQQIGNKPRDETVKEIKGVQIWLSEASIKQDFVEGEMVRLKMDNIPPIGDSEGLLENLA
jgi:hypothetical protein